MTGLNVVPAVDPAARIAELELRVQGLENELRKARRRAFYAEGAAREAEGTVCPMAIGDPHRTCSLAETLADTLARAQERDPTLGEWLEQTADENPEIGGEPQ